MNDVYDKLTVVFNGEIYNYKKINLELIHWNSFKRLNR